MMPKLACGFARCLVVRTTICPCPAQKKAPGKAGSQGGKGHHPFPGAIGRSIELCRGRMCISASRLLASVPAEVCMCRLVAPCNFAPPCRCIRSWRHASLPPTALRWAAGTAEATPRCRPIHRVETRDSLSATDRLFDPFARCSCGGRIWKSPKRVKGGFFADFPGDWLPAASQICRVFCIPTRCLTLFGRLQSNGEEGQGVDAWHEGPSRTIIQAVLAFHARCDSRAALCEHARAMHEREGAWRSASFHAWPPAASCGKVVWLRRAPADSASANVNEPRFLLPILKIVPTGMRAMRAAKGSAKTLSRKKSTN